MQETILSKSPVSSQPGPCALGNGKLGKGGNSSHSACPRGQSRNYRQHRQQKINNNKKKGNKNNWKQQTKKWLVISARNEKNTNYLWNCEFNGNEIFQIKDSSLLFPGHFYPRFAICWKRRLMYNLVVFECDSLFFKRDDRLKKGWIWYGQRDDLGQMSHQVDPRQLFHPANVFISILSCERYTQRIDAASKLGYPSWVYLISLG